MFLRRIIRAADLRGISRRSQRVSGSIAGRGTTKLGERCSIVTCAAFSASAGTRVTAVAPLPITTMRLPA